MLRKTKEVFTMSVVLFPVIAFGLAVVVGRVGTIILNDGDQQA